MKIAGTTAAFLFLFLSCCSSLGAGEIYIWTDKDGTTTLTDRPPPENAKIHDVTRYKDKTSVEIKAEEHQSEIKRQERDQEEIIEEARMANRKAETARKEAEKAIGRAREAGREVEVNIDKYSGSKRKRKQFRSKVQKLSAAAQAEKVRADEAVDRANQAIEAAREAEKRVQELEPLSQ
ncbi:MAG: DUF4124 domain-containing protein [Deltaproteobacteria bacterium]|nr:DUF4124 domain-containing protein [Deltaproteobacteria bacterium]